jgi:enoyl-CoA hydratase/carnithine racemase
LIKTFTSDLKSGTKIGAEHFCYAAGKGKGDMDLKHIFYEKSDGIATITKNNPPDYGMTRGVILEMGKALTDARDDDDISVIVITAGGEGFHAGALVFGEIRPNWNFKPMEFREIIQIGHKLFQMIETLEKPVIGVAKGGALGGGFENLHACDFVIAADTAKFSQPEVKLGLIAGWGGTQRLPRLVGWRKAKEILMTGIEITGKEAETIGLINKAVPLDSVDKEVRKLGERLKKCAPVALAYSKLAMKKVWESNYQSGLDYEIEAEGMVISSGEFNSEVFKAFREGREPVFNKRKKITSGPEWI